MPSPQIRLAIPTGLRELADRIDSKSDRPTLSAIAAATSHGKQRYRQGYTIPLIVAEARLLQQVLSATLHANLLSIDISNLMVI
jgi:hypothetical protein